MSTIQWLLAGVAVAGVVLALAVDRHSGNVRHPPTERVFDRNENP
jgi:hypothetical protein